MSGRFAVTFLTIVFALTFVILYAGGSWLSAYVPWRVPMALPIDARWPFWPGAASVYLTILPVLLLAPFVFRDLRSLLPLFSALMLATFVAFVCFILLPVDPPAITCCAEPLSGAVFRVADFINLERNDVPSLHVAYAFTAALAFATRAGGFGKAAWFVWALAVSVSTLFTWQHYLIDVVTGAALAFVCWHIGTRWARRTDVLAAWDVELLSLQNFVAFSRRHRRYFFISLLVVVRGIPHWRTHRLGRVGFAFLQAMDDILDGDRASTREPLELADEMIEGLESGHFADHDLARLGAAFRAELLARGGTVALHKAIRLLRAMRRDRERVVGRELLDQGALLAHHRETFAPSVDLLLLAAGSRVTANEVPALIDAFGWCSTVRDLDEDLRHGLINVPREVHEQGTTPMWLATERARAVQLLADSQRQIDALGNVRGAKLLRRFAASMRRYL